MSIEITSRHVQIHERLQHYAREKAEGLCLDFPKVNDIHVILDFEGRTYRAEFVANAKGAQIVGLGEHAENVISAIDDAVEKVSRQLRKQREKLIGSRYGAK